MVLSYKRLSYLVMAVLMAFSAFYYYTINNEERYGLGAALGPEFFPNVLAVVLFLLSLLGIFRTWQMEDRKIEIPYAGQILLAAVTTGLFIGAWNLIGLFYPLTFLFVSVLLYSLRIEPGRRAVTATTSMLIALVVTGVIYLAFDLVMSLRF